MTNVTEKYEFSSEDEVPLLKTSVLCKHLKIQ